MNKLAAIPWQPIFRYLLPPAMTAGGAYAGYNYIPKITGYQDVESARRTAAVSNASLMAALSLWMASKGNPAAIRAAMRADPAWPKKLIGGWALSEALPIGVATANRLSTAPQHMADTMKEMSEKETGPDVFKRIMTSAPAKGMGIGAGVAGMAGIGSGLLRRKSEKEEQDKKTRSQMVASDITKLLIPAMVAGGVIGSLKKSPTAPARTTTAPSTLSKSTAEKI